MSRMHPPLALVLSTTVLVIIGVVSVILFVLILVAPWRKVREEPPIDPADEAKLLLHRDPDEPTGEVPRVVVGGGPGDEPGDDAGTDLGELAELSDLADLSDDE
jgi:hypothetical protein